MLELCFKIQYVGYIVTTFDSVCCMTLYVGSCVTLDHSFQSLPVMKTIFSLPDELISYILELLWPPDR